MFGRGKLAIEISVADYYCDPGFRFLILQRASYVTGTFEKKAYELSFRSPMVVHQYTNSSPPPERAKTGADVGIFDWGVQTLVQKIGRAHV